jgi:hypothetical protein
LGAGLSASALFAKHGVRIFAARKEPIIGAENERLCRPKWDAKDSVKTRADRRIGQAEMAVANDQQAAGHEAACEIGDRAGKIFEAEEGIAAGDPGRPKLPWRSTAMQKIAS